MSEQKKRILTGDRPTGKLHLGHYVGTLSNRAKLQDEYDLFLIIADYHALTTKHDPEHIKMLGESVRELVLDYVSAGIDMEKATIYLQSLIPEVAEIALLFGSMVKVPRLERVPTLKDKVKETKGGIPFYSLLGYPILQAADILGAKGDLVPVGKDQESHVELSREIAEKFNKMYGEVFPVPDALIGDIGMLPGVDGSSKMSKSLGNAIYLSDSKEEVEKKVKSMYTDPDRIHPDDPGKVEGNPVFVYHDAFNSNKDEVEDLKKRYKEGKVGDVEVKEKLARAINEFLDPMRERRAKLESNPEKIDEIVIEGSKKAQKVFAQTLSDMREAMGLNYVK